MKKSGSIRAESAPPPPPGCAVAFHGVQVEDYVDPALSGDRRTEVPPARIGEREVDVSVADGAQYIDCK